MTNLPCDPDLFDLLVCPQARVPLKWVGEKLVSTDSETRRSYPVEAGIPIMLIERSTVLDQEAWQAAMDASGPIGGGVEAVRERSR